MTRPVSSTSEKPYWNKHEQGGTGPTSVWVRSPALFCRISRSRPTREDSTRARNSSPTWSQPSVLAELPGDPRWELAALNSNGMAQGNGKMNTE